MSEKTSIKHLLIDKANSTMLAVVAVAAFVTVFSLFATKYMIEKANYQRRAINAKHKVLDQVKANITASQSLITQYKVFAKENPNVLGGTIDGKSNLDGDNARVTLDALPSKYDAPALASSIEKLLLGRNVAIGGIDVKDDQSANPDQAQAQPTTMPANFSFEASSSYATIQQLIQDFERSTRPFDITSLEISGTDANLRVKASAITYYQPAKSLKLSVTKEVK